MNTIREVGTFIQELQTIAPEMTGCIAKLRALERSMKGAVSSMDLLALSNKLTAIVQKHIQQASFESKTPLTWAVSKNSKFIVSWLLKHGARANLADGAGRKPFSYSLNPLNLAIAELLVQHGAFGSYRGIRPNIYVITRRNTPHSFKAMVKSSLEALEKTAVGRRLLKKIERGSHPIFITSGSETCSSTDSDQHGATIRGKGVPTFIFYSGLNATYISSEGRSVLYPNFVTLGHELIHSLHNSYGKSAKKGIQCDRIVWSTDEEYKTIMGFPSKTGTKKEPKITENAILSALGLPERISHYGGEVLKDHDLVFERIRATAALYQRFCKNSHYEGQAHNPPPPMVHITQEYLGPSKQMALVYEVSTKNQSPTNVVVYGPHVTLCRPKDFLWENFDGNQCPKELALKNVCPNLAHAEVHKMGMYRISDSEARASRHQLSEQ